MFRFDKGSIRVYCTYPGKQAGREEAKKKSCNRKITILGTPSTSYILMKNLDYREITATITGLQVLQDARAIIMKQGTSTISGHGNEVPIQSRDFAMHLHVRASYWTFWRI